MLGFFTLNIPFICWSAGRELREIFLLAKASLFTSIAPDHGMPGLAADWGFMDGLFAGDGK